VARGSELLKRGELDQAQQVFRAALQLDEGNPRVLALLGLAYFRANQLASARPIYEELVERLPTDASHRLNLGLLYLKIGDSDRAIGSLEASRALDPSQGRAVSYLGLAYARAGRYAEAYRAFLLAGQHDLAREIEQNLTPAERDGIHAQLQRTGLEPVVARTTSEPRTKPPSAPPRTTKITTGEIVVPDAGDSMPEITIERPPAAPSREARNTDSLQFVMPRTETPIPPAAGQSRISRALDQASPASAAASVAAIRVAAGGAPPIALSQLATEDLVRPEDGDHVFEVSAGGALVVRLLHADSRVMTRLDGVHATGGDLAYELAHRRSRGHQTEEAFDYGGTQLRQVTGRGYLIALPGERVFTAVTLDDDIFYLREDLVFAFEATLRWENGNVPGLRGKLPVVQFRGDGSVALRSAKPLVRVKLPAQGVVFVDAARLAGWIGRVIPRAVVPPAGGPMGEMCVECTGEGVVLVDPIGDPAQAEAPKRRSQPSLPPPPPPPPPEPAAELTLDDEI